MWELLTCAGDIHVWELLTCETSHQSEILHSLIFCKSIVHKIYIIIVNVRPHLDRNILNQLVINFKVIQSGDFPVVEPYFIFFSASLTLN